MSAWGGKLFVPWRCWTHTSDWCMASLNFQTSHVAIPGPVTLPMVPHNRSPGPSAAAMDGLLGPCTAAGHTRSREAHPLRHLASPQLVPHIATDGLPPPDHSGTGVAASVELTIHDIVRVLTMLNSGTHYRV